MGSVLSGLRLGFHPVDHRLKRHEVGALLILLCLTLGACTTTLESRPDYVSMRGAEGAPLPGQAVIVMGAGLRDKVVAAHPGSLTGAANTLVFPIGQVIRDVSTKVLADVFTKGAIVAEATRPNAYGVIVYLDDFRFRYDQASNLGFAITPKVTMSLTIDAIGPDGKALFRKTYGRVDYTTGAYVASLHPAEKINRDVHLALGEIFGEVADDIRATQPNP